MSIDSGTLLDNIHQIGNIFCLKISGEGATPLPKSVRGANVTPPPVSAPGFTILNEK